MPDRPLIRAARRRRPSSPTTRAVAGALVAALAVGLAGCGGSSPKPAPLPPMHPHRAGPVSMFTVGAELYTNTTANIRLLQSLGVQVVRLDMNWTSVAPSPFSRHPPAFDATDPNAYPAASWATYDTIIRQLTARHIGIDLALIGRPPRWAEGPGAPIPARQTFWRPDPRAYGEWVRAVGTRYSGHFTPRGASHPLPRIAFWSIWNEPNVGSPNLAPETTHRGSAVEVAPALYRGLLNAGWDSLHATGHGHDRILVGELAPAGATFKGAPGRLSAMAPLRFLRALYCVGADYRQLRGLQARQRDCPATAAGSARFAAQNPGLFKASGFAIHPYGFTSLPPNVRIPHERDYAELAALPTLEATLDRLLRKYGSHKKFPLWSTEFGFITNPPNNQYTITPTLAAFYLNWAEYMTWQDPRIKSFDQFLIIDPPGPAAFATGLINAAGQLKPTFDAYRMPLFLPATTTTHKHPLLVWGDVRPAPDAARRTHRRQTVEIQFRGGSDKRFSTVRTVPLTGPHGYFEVKQVFPGSGSVRTTWRYPHRRRVFSRTVKITLR